jgi:c-di-GMP-binding flagellar brake protein YcgR
MKSSSGNAHERRYYSRHPIRVPMSLHLIANQTDVRSESVDLSLGGLSFLWRDRLSKGNFLDISIPVKEKLFAIKAKVVYSKEDRKTGRFKTGVLFCDVPSACRARLAEEALEILEYRKQMSSELGRDISEEEAAEQWVQKFASSFTFQPLDPEP